MAMANTAKPTGIYMCSIVCVSLCVFNVHVYVYTRVNLQCVHKLMATANDAKPIVMRVFVLCVLVCIGLMYMCICTHMYIYNECARAHGNGQRCKAHWYVCVCFVCVSLWATANDAKPIVMCVYVLCVLVCMCLMYMRICTHMYIYNECARTHGNGQRCKAHWYVCVCLCLSVGACLMYMCMCTHMYIYNECAQTHGNGQQCKAHCHVCVCLCVLGCACLMYMFMCTHMNNVCARTHGNGQRCKAHWHLCFFLYVLICICLMYTSVCTHMNMNNVYARNHGNGQQCKAHWHLCVCLCVLFCVCWSSCVSCTCVCVHTCTFTTCVHKLMATIQNPEVCVCLFCVCQCVCVSYTCVYVHTCTFTTCVHELMAMANAAKPPITNSQKSSRESTCHTQSLQI